MCGFAQCYFPVALWPARCRGRQRYDFRVRIMHIAKSVIKSGLRIQSREFRICGNLGVVEAGALCACRVKRMPGIELRVGWQISQQHSKGGYMEPSEESAPR